MHLVDMTMFYAMEGGGVRTYLAAKAHWLAQHRQIQHSLVAPALLGSCASDYVAVPSATLPGAGGYRIPLSVAAILRVLQALRPSLIEVGDPYHFAWAAARYKRSQAVPIVAFYHSHVPRVFAQHFGHMGAHLAAKYLRLVYRHFDLVLAPSRLMANYLSDIGVEHVAQQSLGVDTVQFAPGHRDPTLRLRLGLPSNTRLLAYAGRFSPEKNLALLIRAVRTLGPRYHLLLIGSGDRIARSPQLTQLPFQPDARTLSALIGGCDLLVHPGGQETFGLVVLEAMASGIPVLGVNAGGVAELIDARNGLLVAPQSSAALADGIDALYQRDLRQLGHQARAVVCEKYDWNLIVPQIIGHYARLFASRQRADLEARLAYGCE